MVPMASYTPKGDFGAAPFLLPHMQKTDDLRQLLEVKNDFLHLAAHELRGPVGRISGYLSMLRDGDLEANPELESNVLAQMASDAAQLTSLLDGLAALARLEDRAELLRLTHCKVSAIIEAGLAASAAIAEAKNIR